MPQIPVRRWCPAGNFKCVQCEANIKCLNFHLILSGMIYWLLTAGISLWLEGIWWWQGLVETATKHITQIGSHIASLDISKLSSKYILSIFTQFLHHIFFFLILLLLKDNKIACRINWFWLSGSLWETTWPRLVIHLKIICFTPKP